MEGKEITLPVKPQPPEEGDCCGSGCSPCIFDIYKANLRRWEEICREIHDNPTAAKHEARESDVYLSETQYKPFRVKSIATHTHNTRVFSFQAISVVACDSTSGDEGVDIGKAVVVCQALGLKAGQHLIMKGKSEDGSNISRAYTPIRDQSGEFEVLVKLYPNGQMSRYLSHLSVGEITHFRGPYGGFAHRRNVYRRLLMLCAGTGLAPMFSVANAVVHDDWDDTFVRLVLAVRTVDDILLRSELQKLKENWNFTYQICISDSAESKNKIRYGESVHFGRLDKAMLETELSHGDGVLVLICGTETFNVDMTEYVLALGVHKSNIYVF